MKRKQIFSLKILTVFAMTVLLAGCGAGNGANDTGNNGLSSEDIDRVIQEASGDVSESGESREGRFTHFAPYEDLTGRIEFLGLQEYPALEREDYTDQPGEGKVFLVLFLKVGNYSFNRLYFAPEHVHAVVDGEELSSRILFLEPEEYHTMYRNIEAGTEEKGFLAWEVPEDWQTLHFAYGGWDCGEDPITVVSDLTKDDIYEPEPVNW